VEAGGKGEAVSGTVEEVLHPACKCHKQAGRRRAQEELCRRRSGAVVSRLGHQCGRGERLRWGGSGLST